MDSLKERLKKARLEKGISQKELANKIGRAQSAIAALESGRNKESTNIATIAKVLDVDPVWLETGVGQMKNNNKSIEIEAEIEALSGYIQFKQIDICANRENRKSKDYNIQNEVRVVEVSEAWARKNIGKDFKNISVMTATSDSMLPTFSEGDVLFVNITINYYRGDGIYVIDTPGGLLVKRLQTTISGDLKVISDNKNYDPEIISRSNLESIHICGKVEAAWSLQSLS